MYYRQRTARPSKNLSAPKIKEMDLAEGSVAVGQTMPHAWGKHSPDIEECILAVLAGKLD